MDYKTAVEAALNGDDDGFLFLYKNTYTKMYHKALMYVGDRCDAEDVLQDSYIKAKRSLSTLSEPEKFPIWFNRIVVNTSKDFIDKKKSSPVIESADSEDTDIDFMFENICDDNKIFQPEESYSDKEIGNILREMINSLSDEQRMCILMYYFDEQSIHDIAKMISCSENTVKSRLFYGRKNLRKKVEAMQNDGYRFYGAAPIPVLRYFIDKHSAGSEFLNAARISMESSEAVLMTEADTAVTAVSNLTVIGNAAGKRLAAACITVCVLGSGIFAAWAASYFKGFVKLIDLKDELTESIDSSEFENNTDTSSSNDTDILFPDSDIIINTNTSSNSISLNSNVTSRTNSAGTAGTSSRMNNSTDSENRSSSDNVRGTSSEIENESENESENNTNSNTVSSRNNSSVNSQTSSRAASSAVRDTNSQVTSYISSDAGTDTSTDIDTDNSFDEQVLIEGIYSSMLDGFQEQMENTDDIKYKYFVYDVDNNGIDELISIEFIEEYGRDLVIDYYENKRYGNTPTYCCEVLCRLYTCEFENNACRLVNIDGKISYGGGVIYDYSECSDEYISTVAGVSKEEYVFDPKPETVTMSVSKEDGSLYLIIDNSTSDSIPNVNVIYRLDINNNKLNREIIYDEDYKNDITYYRNYDLYDCYDVEDRTPFAEYNELI